MNILIVDDRKENNYLLESLLQGKGHKTFAGGNGKEALEILKKQQIDLIISDILMPVMDGFQLCRQVKTDAKLQKIPFIIYTATYTGPKDEEFALKIGADRFVIKPCEPQEFLRIINEVMVDKTKEKSSEQQIKLPEEDVLKLYNERLVRKLEKKMEQYEEELKERKQAEAELKTQLNLLRIAGETARFGGWSVDLQKNICTWSDAVADIHEMPHGFAPKVEEGINFYAPQWRERITLVFSACAEKGIPYDEEMEIITRTGKRVWVRTIGRSVKNEKGEIIRVEGSFQDITKQKLYLQEIQKKNEFIQTILDNLPIGVAINKIDVGTATYINDKFSEIYGWPSEELKNISEFFQKVYPDENYRNELQKKVLEDINSGDPARMNWENLRVTHKDGSHKYINAVNIPIFNQNVMVSTVMDITELKLKENELELQQQQLQDLVDQKTRELQERVEELERYHDATVNREFRIKELRDEIARLKEER